MNREKAEILLKQIFKLPSFHDEQWQTIEKILNGDKVLLKKQVLESLYVFSFQQQFLQAQQWYFHR